MSKPSLCRRVWLNMHIIRPKPGSIRWVYPFLGALLMRIFATYVSVKPLKTTVCQFLRAIHHSYKPADLLLQHTRGTLVTANTFLFHLFLVHLQFDTLRLTQELISPGASSESTWYARNDQYLFIFPKPMYCDISPTPILSSTRFVASDGGMGGSMEI